MALQAMFDESSKEMAEHISLQSDNEDIVDSVNLVEDRVVGVDGVDDGILGVDGTTVSKVGMKFNDEKDIREGQRNSNANSSLKPHATIQTGCKARITSSVDVCGIRKINTVNLNHNHNHKTSPSKSRLYCYNRELSAHVKRRLEVNDMARISMHKSYNVAVVEAGGYENLICIERIVETMLNKLGGYDLETEICSNASLLFEYANKADNRSRQEYKELTFNTTYLTNKYGLLFALFVGVNHHGQSTLLGCGLVSSTETYVCCSGLGFSACMAKLLRELSPIKIRPCKTRFRLFFRTLDIGGVCGIC
ncbi:protein FAR1-RELATED SEQUENCE 5-like [Olea europaea var. sylvestris]|uniref:protein FAR1-RELATED SEQUENCE 5-like n=1 Tax=Olea europaea var. sylvestris TaxID=158386 RepID=UPI000C1D2F58|nr:protein FAR1-RELATED SEQUENCE 5-like [Olea europaea var. sylvestris]